MKFYNIKDLENKVPKNKSFKHYLRIHENGGRIVKGVNTTADVGVDGIKKQAAKFGNKVDKDGRPPTLSKKVKGSKTNVLFNLGMTESKIDVSYDNWDHEEAVSYSKYLEKHFGNPDEFTNEQTVWHNKDGFKRIVCRDEYILHTSPAPHYDFVYCYVDLEVPENLSDELANCSGSILIDHLKNEVGARCGSLTANATTINFVMDVVAGRAKPVKEVYEKRILDMMDMSEKGKHYKLDWWPDQSGDADPKNPYYKESVDNIDESMLYYANMKEELGEIASTSQIFVDMDGVLADFFGSWTKLTGKDWRQIKGDDLEPALQKIKDKKDFWINLPKTSNADNLLSLIKQVKGSYNILSSPLPGDKNSIPQKKEWIKNNLQDFMPSSVIIDSNKAQYATNKDGTPNILIDDFGKNIASWEAAGGIGFKHKDHKFERTAKDIKQHMQEPVEERELTKGEEKKKEKYVKGMKKAKGDFKDRYGKDADAVMYATATKMAKEALISGLYTTDQVLDLLENFADGKKSGKSKPGRVKKSGASCNGSVTELRKKAKNASGERAKMYHWCANMKSGRKKKGK